MNQLGLNLHTLIYSRKGLCTLYAYSMKLDVTGMPKNMGQQTTNIQLFIAQIQSFAEGGVEPRGKQTSINYSQLEVVKN